ncbi:unnamed protein product [Didymodactylos carnosus]|uniref:NAD(P)(+)--arginine ADP-ribosyltransferase n=1 Tax=Didymodactylos carnosus TaxID=1234261 RepID=A0A814UV44_9BILA|nr:unnamed protein product [Didymodactylos carnosus]CAF3944397.1 unnamed protein product [Didymodactylos carnosus]
MAARKGTRFSDIESTDKYLTPIFQTLPLVSLEKAVEPLINIVSSISEYAKSAKLCCLKDKEYGLTHDESAAIYLYSMENGDDSFHSCLNAALRSENGSGDLKFYLYLKLLDAATNKLPSLSDGIWRGVDKDLSRLFKEGQEITWRAVSSCSRKVHVIKKFLGRTGGSSTLFLIQCVRGKDISAFSCYTDENEIVLMPGTQLRVVSNPLDLEGGRHVIHLKEISESVRTTVIQKTTETLKINYPNGNKYVGEVNVRNEPNGTGTMFYKDGQLKDDCYKGEWKCGKKGGQGIYDFAVGKKWRKYDGRFENDLFSGHGRMTYSDGHLYDGNWLNGRRDGRGVLTWKDGDRYDGQFRDGEMNGHGVKYDISGFTWEGEWKGGKKHGYGWCTHENGDVKEGKWNMGKEMKKEY